MNLSNIINLVLKLIQENPQIINTILSLFSRTQDNTNNELQYSQQNQNYENQYNDNEQNFSNYWELPSYNIDIQNFSKNKKTKKSNSINQDYPKYNLNSNTNQPPNQTNINTNTNTNINIANTLKIVTDLINLFKQNKTNDSNTIKESDSTIKNLHPTQ